MADPQESQDTQQAIEALAVLGGAMVAAAMGTGAWRAARDGTVRLFRREVGRPATMEDRLDVQVRRLAKTRDPGSFREALAEDWENEFAALLRKDPAVQAELALLIAEVHATLPQPRQRWVQTNIARDRGTIFAVQNGSQHNFFMDGPSQAP